LIKQAFKVADRNSPTNFIVEDNILKQILDGFYASLLIVDMPQMLCYKLGFVSLKFAKATFVEIYKNTPRW
jgi:hypothetical protein